MSVECTKETEKPKVWLSIVFEQKIRSKRFSKLVEDSIQNSHKIFQRSQQRTSNISEIAQQITKKAVTFELDKDRYRKKIYQLETEVKNAKKETERVQVVLKDAIRVDSELAGDSSSTPKDTLQSEDMKKTMVELFQVEIATFKQKIKQLENEKQSLQNELKMVRNEKAQLQQKIHVMELANEERKLKNPDVNKIKKFEYEKSPSLQNPSFKCSECKFPVAEYRSHICVDCGLTHGFLINHKGNLQLAGNALQIETQHMVCWGCAVEGVHANHQTTNYQQLKLWPIVEERSKKIDSALADKRDAVNNSPFMATVVRLLQTARVELSKLSEDTPKAVTSEEFNFTWNAADIEFTQALSLAENLLTFTDNTGKSLEKVVAGLTAIRNGCKVCVRNCTTPNIAEAPVINTLEKGCDNNPKWMHSQTSSTVSEWSELSECSAKTLDDDEIGGNA